MSIFIGIDPGLNNTGWGIIQKFDYDNYKLIKCGIFQTNCNDAIEKRLLFLFDSISNLICNYQPDAIAIEKVFINTNPVSSEKLIMARTALLLAIAKAQIQLYEFAPNVVKKNITGAGHSSKETVNNMVQKILKISINTSKFPKSLDSMDALGIALCLALQWR